MAVEPDLGQLAGELRAPGAAVAPRELVDDHPAGVVAVACVLAAGIAETDDEQVERRPLTAGPEPHRGLALRRALVAGGFRPARPEPRLAFGRLALGGLALDALLALDGLFLDLDLARRGGDASRRRSPGRRAA